MIQVRSNYLKQWWPSLLMHIYIYMCVCVCVTFPQWVKTLVYVKETERPPHYSDVIISAMVSQITSVLLVYLTVCSGTHRRKHQSSGSLAFVTGPVNSPHRGPLTRKMFPFDDVIMKPCKKNLEANCSNTAYTAPNNFSHKIGYLLWS